MDEERQSATTETSREVIPAPAGEDQSMEKQQRSFLSKAVRFILGATLSILLGAALGVVGYLGLPLLYQGFTDTVDANARRIANLERTFDREQSELAAASDAGSERIEAFEETLTGQAAALTDLQSQLDSLAAELEEQTRRSSSLPRTERTVEQQATALQVLADRVEALELAISPGGGPLAQLERELLLTQAMSAMIRARIWLLENDLGSATVEVERARGLIVTAAQGLDETAAAPLQAVVDRLDLTLADLETTPFVASEDLEIAWSLLIEAMASEETEPEAEGSAAP